MLDVAHNPHAARVLAAALGAMGFIAAHDRRVRHARRQGHRRRRRGDRARGSTAGTSATLPGPRGARAAILRAALERAGVAAGRDPRVRRRRAGVRARRESEAAEADRIVVFGSFLTVAAALAAQGGALRRRDAAWLSASPTNADLAVDELQRKARRRLVGAIVLALAAAVILPMLLEKEPKPLGDDVSVQIPPVDEGNSSTGSRGDPTDDEGRTPRRCRKRRRPKTEARARSRPPARAGGARRPIEQRKPAPAAAERRRVRRRGKSVAEAGAEGSSPVPGSLRTSRKPTWQPPERSDAAPPPAASPPAPPPAAATPAGTGGERHRPSPCSLRRSPTTRARTRWRRS